MARWMHVLRQYHSFGTIRSIWIAFLELFAFINLVLDAEFIQSLGANLFTQVQSLFRAWYLRRGEHALPDASRWVNQITHRVGVVNLGCKHMLSGAQMVPLQSRSFHIIEAADGTSMLSLLMWCRLILCKILYSRILRIFINSHLTSDVIEARKSTVEHNI